MEFRIVEPVLSIRSLVSHRCCCLQSLLNLYSFDSQSELSLIFLTLTLNRSLPWILRRSAGITLTFQFDGWNCLKDVALHFKKVSMSLFCYLKSINLSFCDFFIPGFNYSSLCLLLSYLQGSIEFVFVGEFKANLSQSLVELCAKAFIQDPKVIFSICDLKIVTRPSNSSKGPRKSKTRKSRSGGSGKLMLFANIGRFFSVSMTNMVVQVIAACSHTYENSFYLVIIPFHYVLLS